MEITYRVIGAERVQLKFERFPEQARAALKGRIAGLTSELEARIKGAEPMRTGRLRAETLSEVFEGKDFVVGKVYMAAGLSTSEYKKIQALEYGSHKMTRVKAHGATLGHFWSRLVAPREVMVAAHSRQVDIEALSYRRGPLAAIAPQAAAAMEEAIAEAAAAAP